MACDCEHKGKGCVDCLQCKYYNFPEIEKLRELSRPELEAECAKAINICRQLNTIIEFSSDSLFITNGEGRIIKVNAAYERISGTPRKELIGKNVNELVGSVISESSTVVSMSDKKPVTIEQTLLKSGKVGFSTSTPIFDDSGILEMVISNNRDFNELEMLKMQLVKEQKRVQEYQEGIEHIKKQLVDHHNIIARDKHTLDALYRANRVARVDSNVLIVGETGTGKEEFAKYIHCTSERKDGPFIRINCGAIAQSIIESELFGYERGAFTGANTTGKKGLFEIANNGTLFLDEIGELAMDMQVKLLRALQEREIIRVGGNKPIKIDIRVIAATNRNLTELMQLKLFREDLYYRISVVTIQLPALRERPDDIMPLTRYFLQELGAKYNIKKVLTRDAFQLLKQYSWPGNVRELKNILEEVVVMSSSLTIKRDDFPISTQFENLEYKMKAGIPLQKVMDDTELKYLQMALEKCGSVRKASAFLKMAPTTFARRLKCLANTMDDHEKGNQ